MDVFLISWGMLILFQILKQLIRQTKVTTGQLVPILISQNCLKNWFIFRSILLWTPNLKCLAGLRKNHNTQHILREMIETWCSVLNKDNKVGAIVMDPPKTFDTLSQNLLLCKLKAYGFDTNALTFIQTYFCNRHQRTKAADKLANGKKYQQKRLKALPVAPTFQHFY